MSGVGRWSIREVAQVIAKASFYLGNDTGLAHLAEAVGTAARVIFGPTVPDMGFGPWRQESFVLQADLGCRPCGKDGRYCYRFTDRYACMKALTAEEVLVHLGPDALREVGQ